MMDAYVDHPDAALYVSTLSAGTYMAVRLGRVKSNAFTPTVGGVGLSTVNRWRVLQIWKQPVGIEL